ncbi:MAG: ADP-ribosyltransferase [Pirellulales bacterium]
MSNRRRDGIRVTAGRHVLKRIPVNGGSNRTAAGARQAAARNVVHTQSVIKRGRKDPADRKTGNPRLNVREQQIARLVTLAYETLPTDIIVEGLTVPGGGTSALDIAVHMAEFEPLFAEVLLDQLDETGFVEFNDVREQVVRHLRNVGKAVETELPSQFAAKQMFGQASPTALKWAQNESAQLMAKTMTGEQVKAIRQVIGAAFSDGLTTGQTSSKLIQILQEIPGPPIAGMAPFANSIKGLTEPWAMAVYHRAEKLADAGKDLVEIIADADKYGAKLRRSRGKMIARTEIMRASNQGKQESYNQMAASGLLQSSAKKIWTTGRFDVCDICTPMNGYMVGVKENFPIGYQGNPPAHPNCRCTTELVPNTKDYALPESLGTGLPGSPLQIKLDPVSLPGGVPSKIKLPSAPTISTPTGAPAISEAAAADGALSTSQLEFWTSDTGQAQPLDWFFTTAKGDVQNAGVQVGQKIEMSVSDLLDQTVWNKTNPNGWGKQLTEYNVNLGSADQKILNFGLTVSDDAILNPQFHNLSVADLDFFVNPPAIPGTIGDALDAGISTTQFLKNSKEMLNEALDDLLELGIKDGEGGAKSFVLDLREYIDDTVQNVDTFTQKVFDLQGKLPHPANPSWDTLSAAEIAELIDTAAMAHKVNDQVTQVLNLLMDTEMSDLAWNGLTTVNKHYDFDEMLAFKSSLDSAKEAAQQAGLYVEDQVLVNFANIQNALQYGPIDEAFSNVAKNEALKLAYGEKLGILGNEAKMLQAKYGKLFSPQDLGSPNYDSAFIIEALPKGKLADEMPWFEKFTGWNEKAADGFKILDAPTEDFINVSTLTVPKSVTNQAKQQLGPKKKPAAKKPTAKKPAKKPAPAESSPGNVNPAASTGEFDRGLFQSLNADELIEDKALGKELSGQNPKKVFVDPKSGQQVIFKPQDRWQAELEQATADLQNRLNVGTGRTPQVRVVELDGQVGSLHEVLGGTLDNTEAIFAGKKFDATKLSPAQLEQMQQNYLFDYLISNYDAHNENFLRLRSSIDKDLLPIGIDKGQAFKHFGKKGEADALLDWMFNPNKNSQSKMPYGQMFEQYAKGDVPGLKFLEDSQQLQDMIATAKYLADSGRLDDILRPYAEAAIQAGKLQAKNADEFIGAITQRFADVDKKWLELEDALLKTEGGKPRLLLAEQKEKLADLDLLDASEFKELPVRSASTKFNKRTDALNRAETAALKRYTGSWYDNANRSLRTARGSRRALNNAMSDDGIVTLRHMDEAFDSHGPIGENITVHRGTSVLADQLGNIIDDPPTQLVGGVFQDHGFVSTSVGGRAAFGGKFALELDIPAEVRGIYVKKISNFSRENEMILERGLNFIVTDVEKVGMNQWKVKAQALPRGQRPDIVPDAEIVDLS